MAWLVCGVWLSIKCKCREFYLATARIRVAVELYWVIRQSKRLKVNSMPVYGTRQSSKTIGLGERQMH